MAPKVNPTPSFPFRRSLLAARVTLTAALLLAASLRAQQPLSLTDAAIRGQTLFQQSAVTGMVLVVVRDREVLIKGYGETIPGSGRTPDAASEIRLCSISKIFAADLLTRLAADRKVALTDPLQRYAPPHIKVPEGPGGAAVTLKDLALHTSGLPREVAAYPKNLPHFIFPDHATRWAWLPKQKLADPPGTDAIYSNVGFDLLGDALATASGQSYAHLLHDTLLQPLDMWDTTLVPSMDQCSRLLRGTSEQGPCTDTQPSGASAGIYSTPADMVKLLDYLLHIPGSPAQPAAAQAIYLKPSQLKTMNGLSHAGDPTGIGLGWIQLGDPNNQSVVLEKTGGGAGFGTYIALSPSRHTGIFVAVTDGSGNAQADLFHESNNLLAALADIPPLPPKSRPAPSAKRHAKLHRRSVAKPKPK
jgi:D-alanyl-D-alanine-carboxypeptidase/D-alanyl-D-alanine-endopeptidase